MPDSSDIWVIFSRLTGQVRIHKFKSVGQDSMSRTAGMLVVSKISTQVNSQLGILLGIQRAQTAKNRFYFSLSRRAMVNVKDRMCHTARNIT